MNAPAIFNYPNRGMKVLIAFIIAILFSYAGEEESFLGAVTDPAFLVIVLFNFIQIYLYIALVIYLIGTRQWSLLYVILAAVSTLVLVELLMSWILEYDDDERTEMYSITFPFGGLIISCLAGYFAIVRQQLAVLIPLPVDTTIWINTLTSKESIMLDKFRYGSLDNGFFTIMTTEEQYQTAYSLKQFTEILPEGSDCFRLNKQQLAHRLAIKSYHPQKDGRIEVRLFDGATAIISKNKAATFKAWILDM